MKNRPTPLEGLNLVGLDFESYFENTQGYSLRNQAYQTSTYVRSPLFQTTSVAIRQEGQRKARPYRGDEAWEAIHAIDWDNTALLAHHAQFDGLILTHHYGVTPRYYCCTLSMARGLHGNKIGNGLDEVAKYYGYRGKVEDVLEQCMGLRREEIPRALMRKLLHYNAVDVDIMWDVFQQMLTNGYPDDELDIVDLTVSLFTEPVLEVDRELAASERDRERAEKEKVFREVAGCVPGLREELNEKIAASEAYVEKKGRARKTDLFTVEEHMQKVLNSNPKFADVLDRLSVQAPMKQSPTHPELQTYAFAKDDLKFQALQAHDKEAVRKAAEGRLRAKSNIGEERAIKLLERSEGGMAFPVYLKVNGAHTMRWSGGDGVNPQNFPVEGRKGNKSALRRCLKAPRGMKLIVVDSSQIEARENAWFAGEVDLLAAFADPKRDPYCEFASELYGRTITKADEEERHVGKTCVLGLGYGMGAAKLQLTLATGAMGPPVFLSLELCQKAVDLFRADNQRIHQKWRFLGKLIAACLDRGQEMWVDDLLYFRKEAIDMPNGLALQYPGLRLERGKTEWETNYFYRQRGNEWSKLYGGLLDENIIQCLSRITVGEQALEIAKRYRIVTLSHDEVVYLAPQSRAKKALDFGIDMLSEPPRWAPDIPLAAEGDYGKVYIKP